MRPCVCVHEWVELEELGSKVLFIFRCGRCSATFSLRFDGPELAVAVLDLGRPAMTPDEVIGLVELLLDHFVFGHSAPRSQPVRHKRRKAA